jgi:hypothetical protein
MFEPGMCCVSGPYETVKTEAAGSSETLIACKMIRHIQESDIKTNYITFTEHFSAVAHYTLLIKYSCFFVTVNIPDSVTAKNETCRRNALR